MGIGGAKGTNRMAKLGIIICGTHYYVMEKVDWWCFPNSGSSDDRWCKYYDYSYPTCRGDKQVGPQELVGWLD